jgi:hypothetical protein
LLELAYLAKNSSTEQDRPMARDLQQRRLQLLV